MLLLLLACTAPKDDDTGTSPVDDTSPVDTSGGDTGAPTLLTLTASVANTTEVHLAADLSAPAETHWSCAADDEEVHTIALAASARPVATLYGLLPETTYHCGVAIPGAGSLGQIDVTTGAFADLPEMDVAADFARMTGAYTLFNNGPNCDTNTSQQVWIVDPEGRARWGWTVPEVATADIDATWLADQTLLIGGGRGVPTRGDGTVRRMTLGQEILYERDTPLTGMDYNHQAEMLSTGEILSIVWQINEGTEGNFYGFGLERLDPATGLASFDWNSQSAIDAGTLPSGPQGSDWLHANSARWFPEDPEGESYWVSLAEQAQVIRIDAATGAITWKLGDGGDFRLYGEDGTELSGLDWFEFQHAISMEVEGDKVLLHMHDNGYTRGYSRALDLLVDPTAKTARIAWQWTEPNWVERAGGDYDVLSTGHRLLTQGHCYCCDESGDRESTITEVDPDDGSVVWRLTVHGTSEWLYRAQRLDGCAIFANAKYCPELREQD